MDKDLVENYLRKMRMIRFNEITEGMARFDKTRIEYKVAENIDRNRRQNQISEFLDKFK